jgi:hypothetical protein
VSICPAFKRLIAVWFRPSGGHGRQRLVTGLFMCGHDEVGVMVLLGGSFKLVTNVVGLLRAFCASGGRSCRP